MSDIPHPAVEILAKISSMFVVLSLGTAWVKPQTGGYVAHITTTGCGISHFMYHKALPLWAFAPTLRAYVTLFKI